MKIPMRFVDEPESPSFSPDGSTVAFSALSGGISDIYTVDLATGKHENLTADDFADFASVIRGEKALPVTPHEDLLVQEALIRASEM